MNARQQKALNEASSPSTAAGSGVNSVRSLQLLQGRRSSRELKGLGTRAGQETQQAEEALTESSKRQDELEEQLYQQRLWGLELQQKQQRQQLAEKQAAARGRAEADLQTELEELSSAQAQEHAALIEQLTRAAALEDVELPRQLAKQRFRPSEKLLQVPLPTHAGPLRGL